MNMTSIEEMKAKGMTDVEIARMDVVECCKGGLPHCDSCQLLTRLLDRLERAETTLRQVVPEIVDGMSVHDIIASNWIVKSRVMQNARDTLAAIKP